MGKPAYQDGQACVSEWMSLPIRMGKHAYQDGRVRLSGWMTLPIRMGKPAYQDGRASLSGRMSLSIMMDEPADQDGQACLSGWTIYGLIQERYLLPTIHKAPLLDLWDIECYFMDNLSSFGLRLWWFDSS